MVSLGRAWWWGLMCLVVGTLYGCGIMDMVAGINADGTPSAGGPGIGDTVARSLGSLFGGYGDAAGVGILWGLREYRSYRLRKAGKEDDNRDGIEDPPVRPA